MSSLPTEPSDESRWIRRWAIWTLGIAVGDATVALLYAGGWLLMKRMMGSGGGALVGVPSLFLVPAVGGFVASYFWRSLKPTIGAAALNSLWMSVLALYAATIAFHEGWICLLIVSPLFHCSLFMGSLIGRLVFRTDPSRLQVSLLPLLVLVVPAELLTRTSKESVVTDQLLIHAPPAMVWPQVTSFPRIPIAPKFWLFRMGLPYPVATTAAGDFINADREGTFSGGAVFKERVIEIEPCQKLTFEIVGLPQDPELIGHLTPWRGQFSLQANPDGTTTLTGSTWYTLHVAPQWYFDLWTKHIFRAVHLRVMQDIRRRAEAPS